MNKIINGLTNLGKSLYGLIIYFATSIIFSYIIRIVLKSNNYIIYNIALISSEIVTLILLLIMFRKRIKKDFIDFDTNYKRYLKIGIKAWLIGLVVMAISNYYITSFITNNIAYNQELNQMVINRYPLYTVIAVIMIGPFVEEIVFRLSFKESIKNKWIYYLLSVLIFTCIHVFNGISNGYELLYIIPYGSLAFAFTYTLDKTNNIFTTTIIHTFHNAIAIVLIILGNFMGV